MLADKQYIVDTNIIGYRPILVAHLVCITFSGATFI
jgi:hypothetical protein